MNTQDAIIQCGCWARQLGIGRNENPFSKYLTHNVISTYWTFWNVGWEAEDCLILQKQVATLQQPLPSRPAKPDTRPNAVEMLPHTDSFMQGNRYGSIKARRANGEILVRLDKSQNLIWCLPEHVKEFSR